MWRVTKTYTGVNRRFIDRLVKICDSAMLHSVNMGENGVETLSESKTAASLEVEHKAAMSKTGHAVLTKLYQNVYQHVQTVTTSKWALTWAVF